MHVKTFGGRRKHARSRPLFRPQPDLFENPFVASDKFAKASTMALRINLSRENFHARYPRIFDLALIPVRGHELAGVDPAL